MREIVPTHLELREGVMLSFALMLPSRAIVSHHSPSQVALKVDSQLDLRSRRECRRKGNSSTLISLIVTEVFGRLDEFLFQGRRRHTRTAKRKRLRGVEDERGCILEYIETNLR